MCFRRASEVFQKSVLHACVRARALTQGLGEADLFIQFTAGATVESVVFGDQCRRPAIQSTEQGLSASATGVVCVSNLPLVRRVHAVGIRGLW